MCDGALELHCTVSKFFSGGEKRNKWVGDIRVTLSLPLWSLKDFLFRVKASVLHRKQNLHTFGGMLYTEG